MQIKYDSRATNQLIQFLETFDRLSSTNSLRERVRELLELHADPKAIIGGRTLPDILLDRDIFDMDRTMLVHILVDKGADFSTHDSRVNWVTKYHYCPSSSIIHARYPHLLADARIRKFCALPVNSAEALQNLISESSDPIDVNIEVDAASRRTKIYAAIHHGQIEFVASLLQYGARVDIKDVNGVSPLDQAIISMRSEENSVIARQMYDLIWRKTMEKSTLEDTYHVRPPDEVVCEQPPTATALRIREIFNFSKGVYTQVIDDLESGKQTSCMRSFDEVGDIGAIALARTAFRKATGREAPQQAYYQSKVITKELPQP